MDKCWLTYVDGYLSCTYNHEMGAECLMKEERTIMKTLYEQFKGDTARFEHKCLSALCTQENHASDFRIEDIGQSYLNSIDCMIAWIMKKGQILMPKPDEYPDPCQIAYTDGMVEMLNYLKEQHKLIEDHEKTKMG